MTDEEISCLRLLESDLDSGEEGTKVTFNETAPS